MRGFDHLEEGDLLDALGRLPLRLVLVDLVVNVYASPQPHQGGNGALLIVFVQKQVLGGLGAERQGHQL